MRLHDHPLHQRRIQERHVGGHHEGVWVLRHVQTAVDAAQCTAVRIRIANDASAEMWLSIGIVHHHHVATQRRHKRDDLFTQCCDLRRR